MNGQLGVVTHQDGRPRYVTSLDIVDGRVATIYIVANPETLIRIEAGTAD